MEAGAPRTFSLALAAGVLCQVVAGHLRIPSIVLLLAMGVALGPDVAGWVNPAALGGGLHAIVAVAVAIILFEGSLNLDVARLRREATAIRRFVLWGAVLTTIGGGLAAHLALGWRYEQALLFGTLVIVTGPTVIRPLLRSVPLRPRLATVLEAEGLLIDPVGAIVAAVALPIVVAPEQGVGSFAASLGVRIGVGLLAGSVAGLALSSALRASRLVPAEARHLVAVAGALLTFTASEHVASESGILAVVVAGVIVGNAERRLARELGEFQEHLTVGLIGLLFVLLAADVRLADVAALGTGGVLTVAALALVVRPVNVAVCTAGADFSWRDKAFLSWVAPRGVVAAAVASITASELDLHGQPGGTELRALVFLTIAVTVALQGGTASLMSHVLGVRVQGRHAVVILPASELGLLLGTMLRESYERVVLADSNPGNCRQAEERGFRVVFGDAFDPLTQWRLRLEQARIVVAVSGNPVLNNHFAETAKQEFGVPDVYASMGPNRASVIARTVGKYGGHVLFDRQQDVQRWDIRIRHGLTETRRATWSSPVDGVPAAASGDPADSHLVLVVEQGGRWIPGSEGRELTAGDHAVVLLNAEQRATAIEALAAAGWHVDTEALATTSPVPAPAV